MARVGNAETSRCYLANIVLVAIMISERTKKALDLVVDTSKLLVTVATAIVTFTTAVLGDKVATRTLPEHVVWAVFAAVISISAGLVAVLIITGTFASSKIPDASISPYHPAIVVASTVQLIAFVAAVLMLAYSLTVAQ